MSDRGRKNSQKHTIQEVEEIINSLGYELLTKYYINNYQKLLIKDKDGYYYEVELNNLITNKKARKFHKSNSYTIQNIKLLIELNNIPLELISDIYIRAYNKLIFKDSEGYFYALSLVTLQQQGVPEIFGKTNPYTLQNIELWCTFNNKPFILVSKEYNGSDKKLEWQCLKCGEKFKCDWGHISIGAGCPFCAGRQVGLSNCLATLNPELAKEWHPTKNGDLTPYDVTCGSGKYAWWLCKECGHEWETPICKRNNNGCPECNKSVGEKAIKLFNNKNNIYFIPQKEFKGLIGLGGGLLSYDFYVPKYNLLIEFQGEQHEKPIDFKGKGLEFAEKQFARQQEHDKRKKEYALSNGYNFLEIWYWDFDNIETILDNYLKELSNKGNSFLI